LKNTIERYGLVRHIPQLYSSAILRSIPFFSSRGNFGRKEIGHIHHNGVADLTFPSEIHDELISEGRAKPHRAPP
jgi:hypothetical protein